MLYSDKTTPICGPVCQARPAAIVKTDLYLQVKEFFSKMLDTTSWPARWHCGTWTEFLGWLYILSDLAIGIAYFAIPILLLRILNKRKDIPFSNILALFIGFILLCGTTHFLDALIFWWPAYRLSALVRFLTGVISIITVIALARILPMVHKLRTADQLEAEVREREKAEHEAKQQLIMKEAAEELMLKRDEFMSIASHELKTPTTIVKASLQYLELMVDKDESLKTIAPFVSKASRQVNKLTRLINDLMDVTKIQAGNFELSESEFNLKTMLEECLEQCLSINSRHTASLAGESNFTIHGDRNRLDQVVSNLLANAFKYSPAGSHVLVNVEKLPGNTITESAQQSSQNRVRISVTDHGVGIPKEKIPYLFDRFYRVEDTAQYVSGVGLGLYISAEIIRKHQGTIGVESEVDKGSEFWFEV